MEHLPGTETDPLPESFGRYEVCKLLGEGAMGRVYLAHDPVLDRKVAIKVIAIDHHTDEPTRKEYLERFTIEARACARLNHVSIVTIYDAGEQNEIPWIAFEYVDGDPLETVLQTCQQLSFDRILAVTLDIAAALHHAHHSGIIHRDIKPANILIDRKTSIAKLTDFGIVKAPWVALTQDGSAVGSPGYMSPEQLNGTGADERSDLFSLGIVMYQMVTGKHPFLRKNIPSTIFATLHGDYIPISTLRPDMPSYLSAIVTTLLATDPLGRFQTAAMLLHELKSASSQQVPVSLVDETAATTNHTRLRRISQMQPTIPLEKGTTRRPLRRLVTRLQHITLTAAGILRQAITAIPTKLSRLATPIYKWKTCFSLMVIGILGAVFFAFRHPDSDHTILKELHNDGFSGSFRAIIDSCTTMIARSQYSSVKAATEKIAVTKRFAVYGDLLQCCIALKEGRDDTIAPLLNRLCSRNKWQRIKNKELAPLIDACTTRLTRNKIDSSLAATLATHIFYDSKDYITKWLAQPDYWLRWNSVRIAGHLALPVDSVAIYLLDLQYGGSVHTRSRAATRLGQLGDTRAIEPLSTAANRGLRDPIVSYTADRVLHNSFRNKNGTAQSNRPRDNDIR